MPHTHLAIHSCMEDTVEPNASICWKLSYTTSKIAFCVTCMRIWGANDYIRMCKCRDKMFKIPWFWQCMQCTWTAYCVCVSGSNFGECFWSYSAFITSRTSGTSRQTEIVLNTNIKCYSHFVQIRQFKNSQKIQPKYLIHAIRFFFHGKIKVGFKFQTTIQVKFFKLYLTIRRNRIWLGMAIAFERLDFKIN